MSLFILTVGCIIQKSDWSYAEEQNGDLAEAQYSMSTSSPSDKDHDNSIKHVLMLKFAVNGTGVSLIIVQVT